MPRIVMKFGGTSVADQPALERLIAIVRAQRQADAQQEGGDARGPIVVVSALSKVTDRLLGVAANAGAGDLEGAQNNLRELRQRFAYVEQEPTIFAGTIADNIRFGKPDATEAEIEAAARSALVHDFVVRGVLLLPAFLRLG